MRDTATSTLHAVMVLGGTIALALGGVELYIDPKLEIMFLEVAAKHERWALKALGNTAEALGYELMPEWECPPEEMPDGATRHWLAEKEVMDDRGALEAV